MKGKYEKGILQACILAGALIVSSTALSEEALVFWIGPDELCDYATIQQALEASPGPQPRDELRLSLRYTHSGTTRLPAGLHVRGGFESCKGKSSGTYTALYAPATQPLFVIEGGIADASSVLADLRLFGDTFGPRQGGVIHMERGTSNLILDNVVIRNGSANQGGAIYMAGGNNRLELYDTQLTANEARMGGGIYCADGSTVTLRSGRIEGNSAQFAGGGLFAQPGCEVIAEPELLARIVVGNRVQDQEIAGLVR